MIKIVLEFETLPVVDGTVADIKWGSVESSMIYSKELDQWNDCLNPGEISDKDPLKCALKIIHFYCGESEMCEELIVPCLVPTHLWKENDIVVHKENEQVGMIVALLDSSDVDPDMEPGEPWYRIDWLTEEFEGHENQDSLRLQ